MDEQAVTKAKSPAPPAPPVDNRPPIVVLRDRLMAREGELRAALVDISTESFVRAVMTSVALNPDILGCTWQSIWNACLRACRDGLLPDGVDGAFVPFKGSVTWIPMYAGLLRRFRRSGNFKWITANVVRAGEVFEHWIDEHGEHFKHVPGDNFSAPIVKVYALATTKDGGVFVAVMGAAEADKIRAISKATRDDSPWKLWPEEMYKKTALRRLSKVLPSARDFSFEEPPEAEPIASPFAGDGADLPRITTAKSALDHFAGDEPQQIEPPSEPQVEPAGDPMVIAHRLGQEAKAQGLHRRGVPGELRSAERGQEALAWLAGWDGEPIPQRKTEQPS